MQRTSIAANKPLAPGKHTLRFDFAYDGGGPGKGGTGALCVDDQKVAVGRIPHTQFGIFSGEIALHWAYPEADRRGEVRPGLAHQAARNDMRVPWTVQVAAMLE